MEDETPSFSSCLGRSEVSPPTRSVRGGSRATRASPAPSRSSMMSSSRRPPAAMTDTSTTPSVLSVNHSVARVGLCASSEARSRQQTFPSSSTMRCESSPVARHDAEVIVRARLPRSTPPVSIAIPAFASARRARLVLSP